MAIRSFQTTNLYSGDVAVLMNGFVRSASHLVLAPIRRIADACDVAGVLVARRTAWRAGSRLYRAAAREGHRSRRSGLLSCLHYLSELT